MMMVLRFCTVCTAQKQVKWNSYLQGAINPVVRDQTIKLNPWLAGLGFQVVSGSNHKLKWNVELNADIQPAEDKVYRFNPDGTELKQVRAVISLFGGIYYPISKTVFLSAAAGPCVNGDRVLFAIKPSLGIFFSKKNRLFGRISFWNIYNREAYSKKNFSSLSFTSGIKLH
jgi:hypothetical protein